MPFTVQSEANDISVQRISGILTLAEFKSGQENLAEGINAGAKPRVLAILENFQGWERGVDWGDIDFVHSEGSRIAKIAIVGDSRWEAEALAFAGAGYRSAPVKFFPADQEAQARAWLAE